MTDLVAPTFRHAQPAPRRPETAEGRPPATAHLPGAERMGAEAGRELVDASKDPLTGPPPSFRTNLLDLVNDIDALIRDIGLARQSAREAYELTPTPSKLGAALPTSRKGV